MGADRRRRRPPPAQGRRRGRRPRPHRARPRRRHDVRRRRRRPPRRPRPGDPRRLAPEVAVLLEALLPTVERWADEVEDLDLPLTLLHNDLHAGNVVRAPDGGLRFFDFGDAVLGAPLAGLLVPLATARQALDLPADDPALWRIADAALEVWSDLVPLDALRAALPAALQLGRLARVESWRRCVATMTPDERADLGSAPPPGWPHCSTPHRWAGPPH
ncbi:phosphotransferase [Nocardioides humi]|uniref:phosphotransferase family protein n=1 Tax=Nocardioides humi TaxID=449461 RepID=UPI001C63E7D8